MDENGLYVQPVFVNFTPVVFPPAKSSLALFDEKGDTVYKGL